MAAKAPRTPARVLNYGTGPPDDGLKREWDICPDCGNKRWQLIIVPDRFHCDRCCKAGPGPNTEVAEPQPEQMDLIVDGVQLEVGETIRIGGSESPPIDEADAWVADEMPDE